MLVLSFAPQKWTDRMSGMAQGTVDESEQQRLITWRMGWNLAMDYPITGAGLEAYPDVAVFQHYQPEPLPRGRKSEGPHSIYFQMLGEQGFVGLGLFVLLLGGCLFSLYTLRRSARRRSPTHWAIPYTRMLQVSLAAFVVSGATLGRAYFDLWYEVVACIVVLQLLYRRELAEEKARKKPAEDLSGLEEEFAVTPDNRTYELIR